jgi:hypothetical protein
MLVKLREWCRRCGDNNDTLRGNTRERKTISTKKQRPGASRA